MAEGMNGAHGRSCAALMEFLTDAMQRGLVPPQTGANYIVACKDILPFVLGEDWALADMTTLDMGTIRRRLVDTKGDRQLSRFNENFLPAVEEFRKHLRLAPSPEPITPPTKGDTEGDPPRRSRPGRPKPTPSKTVPRWSEESEVPTVNSSPALPNFGVIPHLFPLREGILATLLLPADLTAGEARRLTAFIESLALPDVPVAGEPGEEHARPRPAIITA
jgi:hypothetical protein